MMMMFINENYNSSISYTSHVDKHTSIKVLSRVSVFGNVVKTKSLSRQDVISRRNLFLTFFNNVNHQRVVNKKKHSF